MVRCRREGWVVETVGLGMGMEWRGFRVWMDGAVGAERKMGYRDCGTGDARAQDFVWWVSTMRHE